MAEKPDTTKAGNTDEARQGETSGHMRWVLLASLVLVVAVLAFAVFGINYR